ncbi:FAD-binding-3 domain-containing protein [Mycena sanguinolenta]|uniref:FAD-binding-3 domain-containing protein n=1 Tax=Mycena sanguinolenta TaxID=230812 RepID=A0A8H7DH83_9AGAR|nr:FAD-binding-3 domain-containing protein [Mycena sanguinolenta]
MTDSALNFIIVGASVSGLASAIALKSAGHNVLVLEKEPQLGGIGSAKAPNGSGCAQIPPNGCKILVDWGLEAEINAKSAPCWGFSAYKYAATEVPGPDHLGTNRHDPAVLDEARGGYLQFVHRDFVRMLYDLALKSSDKTGTRVSVLFGTEVVNVDCDACSVTLRSGEIHTADGVIGADGTKGVVRRTLLKEEGTSRRSGDDPGVALYHATVPKALVTVWVGSNRGLKTFVVGKENDISLFLYTPDTCPESAWTREAEIKITDVLGPCDERIRKLAELTGPATCIQHEHSQLESWVSESGRVLVLGDAAHPLPPGASQAYAAALEDAAFIGKIFSHTKSPSRVPEFLRAFQEHRKSRVSFIRQIEDEYLYHILLPDGDTQEQRDAFVRARHAAGHNVFEGEMEQMMEDIRIMFSYNATDDADEWWMTWGRYRDAAELSPVIFSNSGTLFDGEQDAKRQD